MSKDKAKRSHVETMALDRASVRRIDENGFLHVDISPLTRVQVAPYYGREIMKWREAGLDPDKIYHVYRPPEELAKPETIRSVNGIPIQANHHDDFAESPAKETRVGATGDQAKFQDPYLMNALHIFDKDAQDAINSGALRELSLAYTYEPDFTAGETANGEKYDLIMRNILANHVALVNGGRAGPNVLVFDSKENPKMDDTDKKVEGAGPVATDQDEPKSDQVQNEPVAVVETESAKDAEPVAATEPAKEPTAKDDIAEVLQGAFTPEQIEALKKILAVVVATDQEPADVTAGEKKDEPVATDEDDEDIVKAITVAGMTPTADLIKAFKLGKATSAAPVVGDTDPTCKASDQEPDEPKQATDAAAIKRSVMEYVEAVEAVKPVIGNIRAGAYDNAAGVYLAALKQLGVNGVKPEAARDAFNAYQAGKSLSARVTAQDSAPQQASAISDLLSGISVG